MVIPRSGLSFDLVMFFLAFIPFANQLDRSRMLKKAVPGQGRSERRDEAYPARYVESLSDARTKLAGFFSIRLEAIQVHHIPYIKDSAPAQQPGSPETRPTPPAPIRRSLRPLRAPW